MYFPSLFSPVNIKTKSKKSKAMSFYSGSKRIAIQDHTSDRNTNSVPITELKARVFYEKKAKDNYMNRRKEFILVLMS